MPLPAVLPVSLRGEVRGKELITNTVKLVDGKRWETRPGPESSGKAGETSI